MKKRECFSHYIFKGSHFEVGIQHGEAFREDIRNHMNMILELAAGNSGLSRDCLLYTSSFLNIGLQVVVYC